MNSTRNTRKNKTTSEMSHYKNRIEKNLNQTLGSPYKFTSPRQNFPTKVGLRTLGDGKFNRTFMPSVPKVNDPEIRELV